MEAIVIFDAENKTATTERMQFGTSKCKVTAVERVELGEMEFTDQKGFGMLQSKGVYVVVTGDKLPPGKWKIIAEREL